MDLLYGSIVLMRILMIISSTLILNRLVKELTRWLGVKNMVLPKGRVAQKKFDGKTYCAVVHEI